MNSEPDIKLDLLQNAFHTLRHALEHMREAERGDDESGYGSRRFDDDTHMVEWENEKGHLCFSLQEFCRPPRRYEYKFALLHLIQATELLIKAYVQKCDPDAIYVDKRKRRTINMHAGIDFLVKRTPGLLSSDGIALLLRAKSLRNDIEHFELRIPRDRLRAICVDFLALDAALSQELFSMNLWELFSWDALRDDFDPLGDFLGSVLGDTSEVGKEAARRAGFLWAAQNPSTQTFLCLNCGALAVVADNQMCMGCGADNDPEISTLAEELNEITSAMVKLREQIDRKRGAVD